MELSLSKKLLIYSNVLFYPIDTEIGFILLKISINEVKRLDINIILIMSSLLLAQ